MTLKAFTVLAIFPASFLVFTHLHAQQGANTLTWHNDIRRSGANLSERYLNPANVNAQKFGKWGFFATDGVVDAQPLFVADLHVSGKVRDVLYIATEHDTVYAKDVKTSELLWKRSFLKTGERTSGPHGSKAIVPEIGITATPVIDLSKGPRGALYVVDVEEDSHGQDHQWINALDLVTGVQLFGGPTEIQASYPGSGDNSHNGRVVFDPNQYAERCGLLESNGVIYTTWTSHGDTRPYTGWIIGYDPSTLKQTSVFNITPNGSEGAVWMSGAGPAAEKGTLYLLDGNGSFDTNLDDKGFPINHDFGNAALAVSLSDNGLYVSDYYATDTTVQQSNTDTDFGSGGIMVIPTKVDSNGNKRELAVAAGKDHNIYLLNRNNMGRYHPNGGSVYQVLSGVLPNGNYSAPAYFNDKIYYGGVGESLQAFSFRESRLLTIASSRSTNKFFYPGTTPSISADGDKNGIVWAVGHSDPAVLYAYNAEDLSETLYDSNQAGSRDQFGSVDRFIALTIARGKVYVPTQKGVAVFGLLTQ